MADPYANVTSPSATDLYIKKRSIRQKDKVDNLNNQKRAWRLYMKRIGAKTDATNTAYIDKDGELTPVQTFNEYQKSGKYWEPPKGPKKVKYLTAGEREKINKLKIQVSQEKTSELASNPNSSDLEKAEATAAQLDAGQEALSTPEMTGDYKTDELALSKAAKQSTPTKEQLKIKKSNVFTKAAFDFAGIKKGQSLGVLTRNQRRMYDKLAAGG